MLTACGSDLTTDDATINTQTFPMQVNNAFDQPSQSGDFVRMSEPKENAFSVLMPRGWQSQISLVRTGKYTRSIGHAISPDQSTCIFFGDANIPTFFNPNVPYAYIIQQEPGAALSHVQSAVDFGKDYIRRSYGNQSQLQLGQAYQDQDLYQYSQNFLQKMGGTQAQLDIAVIPFSFVANGQRIQAELVTTIIAQNEYWVADIGGFTTTHSSVAHIKSMHRIMAKSYEPNQQWIQQEQTRQQQQFQAQYQAKAQRNRQAIQAHQQRRQQQQQAFDAHQQRVRENQQLFDQQTQAWEERQNINDQNHQRFNNYILEENTITNGESESQVQSGYNYYWVNPTTNEYIGTMTSDNPDPMKYQLWKKKN